MSSAKGIWSYCLGWLQRGRMADKMYKRWNFNFFKILNIYLHTSQRIRPSLFFALVLFSTNICSVHHYWNRFLRWTLMTLTLKMKLKDHAMHWIETSLFAIALSFSCWKSSSAVIRWEIVGLKGESANNLSKTLWPRNFSEKWPKFRGECDQLDRVISWRMSQTGS